MFAVIPFMQMEGDNGHTLICSVITPFHLTLSNTQHSHTHTHTHTHARTHKPLVYLIHHTLLFYQQRIGTICGYSIPRDNNPGSIGRRWKRTAYLTRHHQRIGSFCVCCDWSRWNSQLHHQLRTIRHYFKRQLFLGRFYYWPQHSPPR
jgi:hypothetical protein